MLDALDNTRLAYRDRALTGSQDHLGTLIECRPEDYRRYPILATSIRLRQQPQTETGLVILAWIGPFETSGQCSKAHHHLT